MTQQQDTRKVIIIGSGPAGHTAAIYTARAELSPLMFEGWMAEGIAAGGQLTITSIVENFPGFPEGISGPQLMLDMRKQSQQFGTDIITETIQSVDLQHRPFTVFTDTALYKTHIIIIATGATAKRLDIKGEELFWEKGISACAVCDGALPIFRNNPLLVIGGGDAACEEAEFLTKFGSVVYMAVRRDVLRASKTMQQRVFKNKKITILWKTEVIEAKGKDTLAEVVLKKKTSNTTEILAINGLFYAVGHIPNTSFLHNQIELNNAQYILTKPESTETSVEGVFACGDVQDARYRQAITAAGSGCMAALEAERYYTIHHSQ